MFPRLLNGLTGMDTPECDRPPLPSLPGEDSLELLWEQRREGQQEQGKKELHVVPSLL